MIKQSGEVDLIQIETEVPIIVGVLKSHMQRLDLATKVGLCLQRYAAFKSIGFQMLLRYTTKNSHMD